VGGALRRPFRNVPDRHAHQQALENPSLGPSGRGDPANDQGARGQSAAGLFLGANVWFARTILAVQYWRSFEALEAYAHARDNAHLPAWAAFNRAVGANGDVGIFHETYKIEPGAHENVYVNMPPLLLGRIGALVEASGGLNSARGRMAKRTHLEA